MKVSIYKDNRHYASFNCDFWIEKDGLIIFRNQDKKGITDVYACSKSFDILIDYQSK